MKHCFYLWMFIQERSGMNYLQNICFQRIEMQPLIFFIETNTADILNQLRCQLTYYVLRLEHLGITWMKKVLSLYLWFYIANISNYGNYLYFKWNRWNIVIFVWFFLNGSLRLQNKKCTIFRSSILQWNYFSFSCYASVLSEREMIFCICIISLIRGLYEACNSSCWCPKKINYRHEQ